MNMFFTHIRSSNYTSLIVFLLFSFCSLAQYKEHRPDEFLKALSFLNEHKSEFKNCVSGTSLNFKQAFAIVAPEISEYSSVKNYFESQSLKVLYVQRGKGYSDFSVGYFQMKPSFVEKLEKTVSNELNLYKSFQGYLINLKDPKSERRERLKRLESKNWQFKYLKLFITIVANKTKNQKFLNEEEEIQFYSTAYNAGFHKSKQDILREMNMERFPNFSLKKFNYSKVSLEFYKAIH
jgi:hypothetical protein